ncbi:hypothetical protein SAMN04515671_3773 [Nakamurella panacisegetis]|uniref:Transcriptional regulator, AlpA family n=1 Tax=Nakamurella panacisegetis TaxID=1090615 RepID=A0A1H0RVE9_9ACTN|nr:hypothetical protein [Nakamurella panacisegetis]SDP33561.1 hypothetical protein SAMN04515671_3773 [Nakamurella panacisegetis]
MPPRIRKLSTREAAALAQMPVTTFRSAMRHYRQSTGQDLRLPETEWPDSRTPMYDEKAVRKWLASRPGRGRWGKRPPAQT